jgi:hypothetical protein
MSWMAIDRIDFSPEDVEERLHALFEAAKTADEFEFACTLLRLRGMEDAGWDPFVETQRLVEDLMALIDTPLVGHTKIRLGLLLYSHLTEVGAVYEVLANLSRVHAGERYSIDPFLDYCSRNRKGEVQFLSTRAKVNALKEMLEGAGQVAVVEVLDWFFNPSVRNAFAHADYTLHQDKFRCRSESFEIGGGIQTSELSLQALVDLFNRALAFFQAFMREYTEQRTGYQANRVVAGRIAGGPAPEPVELLADSEHGLYGFRSPPAAEQAGSERRAG